MLLLNHGFFVQHSKRKINSIYFDTQNLDDFWDGEEGSVPRAKTRFRWYGNLNGFPNRGRLERKLTLFNSREKVYFDIEIEQPSELQSLLFRHFGVFLYPTVQVEYEREYFADRHGNRATLDYNMVFKKVDHDYSSELYIRDTSCVLELKTELAEDELLLLPSIHSKRVRFSKYCNAIKQCLNINS